MLLCALTRFGPRAELETEVPALAPVLGIGAYELRLALASTPPVVLASTEDLARAREIVLLMRSRGHGAVACDASAITASDTMLQPREFRFEPASLWVEAPNAGGLSLDYANLLLIAEATHAREEEKSEEHAHKKLSLARTVLTGGLVNTKTVRRSSRQTSEERERVLYLIQANGGHVLLREQYLRYTGLGAQIGRTVTENFTELRTLLRARASGALYDDRLAKSRRTGASVQVSGTSTARTVTKSNASETDLAVHLIAVGQLQGQL